MASVISTVTLVIAVVFKTFVFFALKGQIPDGRTLGEAEFRQQRPKREIPQTDGHQGKFKSCTQNSQCVWARAGLNLRWNGMENFLNVPRT